MEQIVHQLIGMLSHYLQGFNMSGGDRQISEPSNGMIRTAFPLQEQAKASEEKLLQMLVRSLGIDTKPVEFFGVSGQLDLVLQNWWKSQLPPIESSQPLGKKRLLGFV